MKITDEKTFCFIHIPKCAGTSITDILEKNFDCVVYKDRKKVPNGGIKDLSHMTMEELQEFFPERLELCRKLYSFCCIRDPYSRFISSFKYEVDHKTWQLLGGDCDELSRYFNSVKYHHNQKNRFSPKHVLATPQYKYIFLNGEKIVDKCYDVTNGLKFIEINGRIFNIPNHNVSKNPNCDLNICGKLKDELDEFYSKDFELISKLND